MDAKQAMRLAIRGLERMQGYGQTVFFAAAGPRHQGAVPRARRNAVPITTTTSAKCKPCRATNSSAWSSKPGIGPTTAGFRKEATDDDLRYAEAELDGIGLARLFEMPTVLDARSGPRATTESLSEGPRRGDRQRPSRLQRADGRTPPRAASIRRRKNEKLDEWTDAQGVELDHSAPIGEHLWRNVELVFGDGGYRAADPFELAHRIAVALGGGDGTIEGAPQLQPGRGRRLMATADIRITAGDRFGIPLEARCAACGEWWERPRRDPTAISLQFFGFAHADCPNPKEAARDGRS